MYIVKEKLLNNFPATAVYDMCWSGTCHKEQPLSSEDAEVERSETVSYLWNHLPWNEQLADSKQENTNEFHGKDEKFDLFRNQASKQVLHTYLAIMESGKKEEAEDNDGETSK